MQSMCSAAFRVFIRPLISYVILKSSEKTFSSLLSIPRIRGLLRVYLPLFIGCITQEMGKRGNNESVRVVYSLLQCVSRAFFNVFRNFSSHDFSFPFVQKDQTVLWIIEL